MDVLNIEFDLPFDEAIAWGENRVSVLPQFYYGVLQAQARAQAFTVSGLTALQQIQDVQDSLNKALGNGLTLRDWQKLQSAETVALGKWRMETIFRTHVQTCYSVGRTQQQRENAAHRPFLMYDAINDSRTRPNHTALDNFIAPLNDPIWKKITPPNGFNCRCTTIALTEAQAIKRGWKGFTEYRDKGEPDKGWDYNPADSQDDRLDKIKAERLAKADPVVAEKVGDNGGMENPQRLSQVEKQKFAQWTNAVLAEGYMPQNEFLRVGFLPEKVLNDSGVKAIGVLGNEIEISDKLLRHGYRSDKGSRGAALSAEVLSQLPQKLEESMWFFDSRHGNVMAVFDIGAKERIGKAAVQFNYVRRKDRKTAIVTTGMIDRFNLRERHIREIK